MKKTILITLIALGVFGCVERDSNKIILTPYQLQEIHNKGEKFEKDLINNLNKKQDGKIRICKRKN